MTKADNRKDQRPEAEGPAAEDWESIALRRVARRMETLPESPPHGDDFGWEEAVIEKLRERLADD
jgi:hypothetical protein